MALGTRKKIKLLDMSQNVIGEFVADVTEVSMAQASMLANVIDASKNLSLVVRLKYAQSDLRQGFIQVQGYSKLFSITRNVKVYKSNTFYVVESSRKANV